MAQTERNSFAVLASVDVSAHLEKKGPYSYLSWPYAVAELRKAEPTATWEVIRWNGLPYLQTEAGSFVEVAVTVNGIRLSQLLPVLDGKNRVILAPNAFDINTSIQRALVKCIALHGLGLSIYAGEDIPMTDQAEPEPAPTRSRQAPAKRSTQLKQVGTGLSSEQQDKISKLIDETGADLDRLLAYFQVEKLADIRANQFDRVIRSLEHRRAA
jgi:hypothetical protein